MNPVLRWAGSKRKLLRELRETAPPHFERYLEPFAGSAVLFFELLPRRGVLGDLNPEVIATYSALRDTPSEVDSYLRSIPTTKEAYYTLRSLDPAAMSPPQRAARLIFLMKACFNGVYRTNRQGKFNVPLGNRFFALPTQETIAEVSKALQGIELIEGDFLDTITTARAGDFVYLDPPYSESTRFRGEYSYQGAFKPADESRLIGACNELSAKGVSVLLSFKECEHLRRSLNNWSVQYIDVARSVAGFGHSRRLAREVLLYNY
ncbi:DNA adenine methylase [Rubrivivax gelatinosus]|uniref:DNA adenine methylase n=1 Tax=Rubrivivax gelatinosus TaxID=28068 RepID=UPI0009DA4007|nr:Dam family site-specific DNA-(adenine-N6)-methyltransferase [Rubrivivax gelatinosus]MBG6080933.1 DNA adenine methylase [Rubrivivax gelatinosus]